jgi:ubiquinol-cytochrome c reductase iron-sulfur subunit
MATSSHPAPGSAGHGDVQRRDFLILAAGAFSALGAGAALWPFIHSLNPAADTLALASIETDLSPVQAGQRIKVMWRGKPVFIDHRTPERIEQARTVSLAELPDPESDARRTQKPEWLIVEGVCTHLGCVPLGTGGTEPRGEYGGWFCPCHGSHYDTSGRIRKGPAPRNLHVPPYTFLTDTSIRIG